MLFMWLCQQRLGLGTLGATLSTMVQWQGSKVSFYLTRVLHRDVVDIYLGTIIGELGNMVPGVTFPGLHLGMLVVW